MLRERATILGRLYVFVVAFSIPGPKNILPQGLKEADNIPPRSLCPSAPWTKANQGQPQRSLDEWTMGQVCSGYEIWGLYM